MAPRLLLRSKRLAAQSLSHVPTFKRGEILIIQRLGLVAGPLTPSASARKAYEALFEAGSNASSIKALAVAEAQAHFLGCVAALSRLSTIYVISKFESIR